MEKSVPLSDIFGSNELPDAKNTLKKYYSIIPCIIIWENGLPIKYRYDQKSNSVITL